MSSEFPERQVEHEQQESHSVAASEQAAQIDVGGCNTEPPVVDPREAANLSSVESVYSAENANSAGSPGSAGKSAQLLREPEHLHPSSILFEVITQVRQYLVAALIGLFGAASGNAWGFGLTGVAVGLSLAVTLIRYHTLRYRIDGDEFVLTEGLIFRRIRSVPLSRIQNMDLVQNALHRIFDVAVVKIETASGDNPEATLRVLTRQQIEELRTAIFRKERVSSPSQTAAANEATPLPQSETQVDEQGKSLWAIPIKHLILAGLASNRGIVLLGVLVGLYFQGYQNGERPRIATEQLLRMIPDWLEQQPPWILISVGIVTVFLVLRIVGVVWYILHFYDYRLSRHGEDLRISCGLFTRVSATIPRRRIQFISVHRSWLMRPLGLASMRIETAGGGGTEHENASANISRRWFVPVIPLAQANAILAELRRELVWPQADAVWHPVSKRTFSRLMRAVVVTCLVLSAVGAWLFWPWGGLAGLVALPLLSWLASRAARARRFAQFSWGLAFQSGLLTRKLSFAFYDRIQNVSYAQSYFDRRWKMARLEVDTAAAGPADHLIEIHYLDEPFAQQRFEELKFATSTHRPNFG